MSKKWKSTLDKVSLGLITASAINLGLSAWAGLDLIGSVIGVGTLAMVINSAIAVSGIWTLARWIKLVK